MRRSADGRPRLTPPTLRQEIGLSVVLAIQVSIMFVVAPLAATGFLSITWVDVFRFGLAAVAALMVAHSRAMTWTIAIAFIASVSVTFGLRGAPFERANYLYRDVVTTAFDLSVAIAVAIVVFRPGRVTVPRIMGAVILYLSIGMIFANAYRAAAISLHPSFSGLVLERRTGLSQLLYFSLGTLTTGGSGDIAPLHPFVRSLANLEAVIGQLFPATLLARLVTLHAAGGRQGGPPDAPR